MPQTETVGRAETWCQALLADGTLPEAETAWGQEEGNGCSPAEGHLEHGEEPWSRPLQQMLMSPGSSLKLMGTLWSPCGRWSESQQGVWGISTPPESIPQPTMSFIL